MESLFLLVVLGALAAIWGANLRARELATNVARDFCRNRDLQFLDDTVSLAMLRPMVYQGRLCLRRRYHFEFSEDVDLRRKGIIEFAGLRLREVHVEPYESSPRQAGEFRRWHL